MSDTAADVSNGSSIRVENLGKQYRIGEIGEVAGSVRESLLTLPRKAWRGARSILEGKTPGAGDQLFWALRDVSFELRPGEVIGILGRNGAGKSTLLKILSRITEPTEGTARIRGRVGTLLEIATGFDPELTGRENIFLSGAILGMKRAEIQAKFDQIVAFAELEQFLDTPVKKYSSGMYVRLGFAVAAHLEPEVLLIDEVLAVGDATFKEKCLGKMREVGRGGRTVLFVSHNLNAISTLTQKALVLDKGRLVQFSDTASALATYRSLWTKGNWSEFLDESKEEGIRRAKVFTSDSGQIHRFGEPLTFEFDIIFANKPKTGALSLHIVDEQARPVIHCWLYDTETAWSREGMTRLRCTLPKPKLYMGRYTVTAELSDRASLIEMETLDGLCPFEVVMDGISKEGGWSPNACAYIETADWEVL